MHPYLKKDFVFTAPKGDPFSAGGGKQLSVVIQWSQNVLDIKAAFTWPHMHSCIKPSHMQEIMSFYKSQDKFILRCNILLIKQVSFQIDSYEISGLVKSLQIS